MNKLIQTEDKDFLRDMKSKALINTNVAELQKRKEEIKRINEMKQLKDDVAEMKKLLNTLLEKMTNGS